MDFGCFVLEDGGTWIWGCPSCPIGSDLVCFWYKLFLKALRQALGGAWNFLSVLLTSLFEG